MPFVPFATASTDAEYNPQRLVNWFPRPSQGGVSPVALRGRSGLQSVANVGAPVRALAVFADALYIAGGGKLWRYMGGTLKELGFIADGPTQMIATRSAQVAVVANERYFVWDGTTVTETATGALTGPRGVSYIDGYTLLIGESGGRSDAFTISGLDDPTSFNALDFAFAEYRPDRLIAIEVDHGELWLMGEETTEVWRNVGAAAFPFQRAQGGIQERGCTPRTVAKDDNAVIWVGNDRVVYRSDGIQPIALSTREWDEVLETATIDGAFIHKDRGHKFYVVKLRGRPAIAYDFTTNVWVEFSTGLPDQEWVATASVAVGATRYVGTDTGDVCALGGYTDAGVTIECEAVSSPITMGGEYVRLSSVDARFGSGSAGGRVMLQASSNGKVWGQERWRKIGGAGQYMERAAWHALGARRLHFLRLRVTDPVNRDLFGVSYG